MHQVNCENSFGDNLFNCKNVWGFDIFMDNEFVIRRLGRGSKLRMEWGKLDRIGRI